jgi:hypothetical protein
LSWAAAADWWRGEKLWNANCCCLFWVVIDFFFYVVKVGMQLLLGGGLCMCNEYYSWHLII